MMSLNQIQDHSFCFDIYFSAHGNSHQSSIASLKYLPKIQGYEYEPFPDSLTCFNLCSSHCLTACCLLTRPVNLEGVLYYQCVVFVSVLEACDTKTNSFYVQTYLAIKLFLTFETLYWYNWCTSQTVSQLQPDIQIHQLLPFLCAICIS